MISVNIIAIRPYSTYGVAESIINAKSAKKGDNCIEDIIDIGPSDNDLTGEDSGTNKIEDDKAKEIPPVDRMPTVFKGLLGGLSSGFGLF